MSDFTMSQEMAFPWKLYYSGVREGWQERLLWWHCGYTGCKEPQEDGWKARMYREMCRRFMTRRMRQMDM